MRGLTFFIKLFGQHFKWMVLGTGLGLLALISVVGLLSLSGWFISAAAIAGLTTATAQLFNFFHPSIGVRFFAIGRTLARYAERIVTHDVTFRILQSLRSWFYIHLEPLAPARLMMLRSADVLNRIVADIDALDNLYLRIISPSVVAAIISILIVGFLGIFDPIIALTVAFFLVLAGLGVPALAWRLGRASGKDLTHHISDLRIHIVDTLQGMPELLVFGGHQRQMDSVGHSNQSLLKCQLRMSHIRGFSLALISLFTGLAVISTLCMVVNLVNREMLNGPTPALLLLAVMASFEAVLPLPLAYQYLGQTQEAGRRLLEIIDTEPEVVFTADPAPLHRQIKVTFENVCFRYNEQGPWVLQDVNFQLPAGRRLAVIGETGSGKSTLIHLLVRFWNAASGRIRLADDNIENFYEPDLRRLISTVSQQPHMFNATLKDNLLISSPDAGEDELWSALKAAQLHEFVNGLPDGLNTWIGEAGQLLSGGQAKRVAVARAVLHNGPLWVLDEPTEGLDPITATAMMQALKQHTLGKTLLLITHRLVDLHWMDHIVMLERGRIIGQGSHEELLGRNERYATLHRRIT